jgi:hypothetical protein
MSLEATIQENTNAIRELIAAIKSGVPTTAAQVAAVVTEAKTTPCAGHGAETAKEEGKAKPEKETAAKNAAATEAAASTQSTAEAGADAAQEKKADNSEASDKAAEVPAYPSVVSAINKLAQGKGRDAAVAVLSKFGVTRGPELKPEQYAAVIAACEEAGA